MSSECWTKPLRSAGPPQALTSPDRTLFAHAAEAVGLLREALEGVEDARLHDAHGLLGDAHLRVHLLEHLVDGGLVGLAVLLGLLLHPLDLLVLGGRLGHLLGQRHDGGWERKLMAVVEHWLDPA